MKKKLTLQDFADYIVQHEGIDAKDADAFVRAFFEVIEEGLHEDKFVKIKGFGTFKLVSVSERESVNVNTGERIQISGHTKVSFTPDNAMKELVNRPFAHFETVDLNDDTDTKEFEEIDEEMETEEAEDETFSEEQEDVTAEADNQEESNEPSTNEEEELNVTSAHNVTDGSSIQTSHGESTDNSAPQSAALPNSIDNTTPTTIISEDEDEEEDETVVEDTQEVEQTQPATDDAPHTDSTSTTESKHSDNEEDIIVTDPTPIIAHSSQSDGTGTTSNTLGYTYAEVPSRKKHNWWRTLALTLCVIMLMAGSYFAGYYRILCPECNDIFVPQPTEVVDTTTTQATTTPVIAQPADSTQSDSATTQEASPTPQQQPAANASTEVVNSSASNKDNTKANADTPKKDAKTTTDNAEKRPSIYRVKPGDNLSRIAKKYYGDDKYAEKIIRHNNLKDANTIRVGMDLQLP